MNNQYLIFFPTRDIRHVRQVALKDSDWTQLPDSPLTVEQKTAWATYRQALRDLPETVEVKEGYSFEDFPTPPTL